MGVFVDILKDKYPVAYGTAWKASYGVRAETTDATDFEIADKQPTIIQSSGCGVAKFHNPGKKQIEVLDFEAFIDQFTQSRSAGYGKKCDFILTDTNGTDVIIFNEISKLDSQSLQAFPWQEQKSAGPHNKAEKATEQLRCSIERLYASEAIASHINGYHSKVGLFSYRLKDAEKPNAATRAMEGFNAPLRVQRSIKIYGLLPCGFEYLRVLYPEGGEV